MPRRQQKAIKLNQDITESMGAGNFDAALQRIERLPKQRGEEAYHYYHTKASCLYLKAIKDENISRTEKDNLLQ